MESIVKADIAENEVKAEKQEEGQAYDVIHEIQQTYLYDLLLVPRYSMNLRAEWISVEKGKLKVSLPEADENQGAAGGRGGESAPLAAQGGKAVEKVIKLVNEELHKHGIQHFVAVHHETNGQEMCCRVTNTHIHVIVECTKYARDFSLMKNKNLSSRKFTTLLAQSNGTLGDKMTQLNWTLKASYLNYPKDTLGMLKKRTCQPLGCSTIIMKNYVDSIDPQEGIIKRFRLPNGSLRDADRDNVKLLKEKIDSLEKQVQMLTLKLYHEKEAPNEEKSQVTVDLRNHIADLKCKNIALENDNVYYKNRVRELEESQQKQSAEIQQLRKSLGDRDHLKEE